MAVNNPINSQQALAPTDSPTFNALTLTTDLTVANGGTGASTLTGVLTGNGASAITANAVTQYGTVIAGASNAVSSVAPSATTGVPYISQGASANPTFGTAVVAGGGTGNTTFTAYSVIAAGTTATGAFQNVSGVGTSGQVLTSNGAAALPTWQSVPAGATDVTAAAVLTDNAVIRGDGGSRGAQTSTVLISDAGEMTNPSQPAFLAYLATNDDNSTGDGTSFTFGSITALTEIYDQGSDFNTNGTFTAPVTGKYMLGANIMFQGLVAATNGSNNSITTSNNTFTIGNNAGSFTGNNAYNYMQFCDMDAADTASVSLSITGGTKIVDLFGGVRTNFYGYLVC